MPGPYYGNLIKHTSGIEATIGTPPSTKLYVDWLLDCKYSKVASQNPITGYKGVSTGLLDISEVNHYWQWTKDLYFRYNGYSISSLAALLAGGDSVSGSSSPYAHALALANTSDFVKTNHSWFDDASATVQEMSHGTIESWKLTWDTASGNLQLEVVEDTFAPINQTNQSGLYTAPSSTPANYTSISKVNAGRVSRGVDVQYKIYNSAGTAYTCTAKAGDITLSRPTTAYFGQNLASAGGGAPTDPLNPDGFWSDALAISGDVTVIFDGNLTGTAYDDYKLFKELAGSGYAPHQIVFNDPSGVYSLTLNLGPIRWGQAAVDRSQSPIILTLPFTAYSDEDVASGNGTVPIQSWVDTSHFVLAYIPPQLSTGSLFTSWIGGTSSATDNAAALTAFAVASSTGHITVSSTLTDTSGAGGKPGYTSVSFVGGTQANGLVSATVVSPLSVVVF